MNKKDVYELTSSQKNIWDTELFFNHTNMNNVGGYVFVEEKVDLSLLEKAIQLFVQKNDALRTKLTLIDGEPFQYVEPYSPFTLKTVHLKNMDEVEDFNYSITQKPFTILDSSLFRFVLFDLPNGFGGFNVTLHHFISDAWTMSILVTGIINFYDSLVHSHIIDDSNFPSYIDYIISQRDYKNSARFEKDASFWASLFNEQPELSFISPKNKKQEINTLAKRKAFSLDSDLYYKINDFCKTNNCSIYTFFMAIYSLYLAKINNVNSSIIGTPVLNRTGYKEKNTAGMFISTIPFKLTIDKDISFSTFVKNVATTQLSIFKHQKYPYDELLQNIKKKYQLTENLYDLVLSYQNAKNNKQDSSISYHTKWLENNHILDPLEVHFYDMDDTGILNIFYDFQVAKFTEQEIESIHSHILRMVDSVLSMPEILLKDIPILSEEQEELILNTFNDTQMPYDKNHTILQIFAENVKKHLSDTALVFEEVCYTYRDLDKKSNQLANFLSSLKLPKNSVIGIMLERSDFTIISMLGVLKANLAYMLIEKDLPSDRIMFMLSNANSPCLITSHHVANIDFANKVYIDDVDFESLDAKALPILDKSDDPLSVVYTSGSTGLPKGVLVKRYSVVNLVHGYAHSMHTDRFHNFLSICSVAFDMFAAEVWIALLSGKKLVLANEQESKEPIPMSNLITRENCEFMLITSSKMDLLLANEKTRSCLNLVKAVQLGGEVLSPKFYDNLKQYTNAEIYNGYGPSETTSCCSCKHVLSSEDINIGKPLPNVQIYICNNDLNLCPIGVTGEICIAGDGVSYGYINNEKTTHKNFVKNPYGNGLLYKSGDLGKWTQNGDIEYVGRNDFQIKIRGLRVELEEINKMIKSLPNVQNSVTIVKKVNHIDSICAYVVATDKSMEDVSSLKEQLAKSLPYYMIPSHFVFMDSLPLTTNGKIDTRSLPEIKLEEKYVAPKTKTEKYLVTIFEKFLNINKVSVYSNFFALGGDSLIAIKLLTQINYDLKIDLKVQDIFSHPNIYTLSAYIDEKEPMEESSFKMEKIEKSDSYPATSAQKRVFYTMQMNPDTVAYNTPGGIIFDTIPDLSALEKSLCALIQRHESLRTYFVLEQDEVVQKIKNDIDFSLDIISDKYANLDNLFKEFLHPFDLSVAPLFRTKFVKFDNGKGILFIDFHHIVCDGSSISIFVDELCKLYAGQTLEPISFTYKDYAIAEKNYQNSETFKEDENFWLSQLEGDIPVLDMPTSYARPNTYSFEGSKITSEFFDFDKLLELCKKLNTTPYMFLLCIYEILLYKYTNQTDIIIGTPIVGRNIPEISNIIGMFVNTLVLRNEINSEQSFSQLLLAVSTNCLNCFDHSSYPFDQLVEKLNIPRDASRNPIFDTMFVYQNEGNPNISIDSIKTSYYVPDNKTSKFDFLLEITPLDSSLKFNLEYRTKLFSKKFMEDFLAHYIQILNVVISNIDIKIKDISMLSDEESSHILQAYDKRVLSYPSNSSIIELFEEQVTKNPNSTAIIYGEQKLTYRELKKEVDLFSSYLYRRGVKKGEIIGTLLDRSSHLIIAMLSIMKCGCVYLPISTDFPQDRIEYMIQNSKLNILITESSYHGSYFNKDAICMDKINLSKIQNIPVSYSPDDIIYSIYTSGSTGKPKGVLITNRNLNNFIHSFNKLYDYSVSTKDICLATTSICFDVSIWEFFFTLLNGATLCLYEKNTIEDIFDFCDTLIDRKITMAYLPPNILNEVYAILSQSTKKVHLQKLLIGVEPIKTSTISKYFELNPDMKIVNGYGPTETTICCTAFVVTPSVCEKYPIIPIGKPLYNLKAYILDKDLCPVPVGVPGELYIAGDNVSNGYVHNKKLTDEKFTISPFDPSQRMYSTGDVVKMLPDNNISFIGRNDGQVKIKGHRIELSEISNIILSYPSVTKCWTIVKEKNNNKIIVSFFTADKKVILNDLRSFLTLKLPFYSVPNHFVQLDKFVLTTNGKIDKKYLDGIKLQDTNHYEAPHNDFQEKLVKLWKEFLNVDKIGINDNFFDLGGDSLIAIRMQIEAFRLGLNISYADIFSHPTIKQLSEKIAVHSSPLDIGDYDYSKINALLEKNQSPVTKRVKKVKLKNILLTGVTGFVGIHILDKLLSDTKATIYCLVRNKNHVSYTDRLYKTLQFYFGHKYDKLVGTRIQIIKGNVTEKHLGLSDESYSFLGNKISCIINSAAIVKHYGKSSVFNEVNIKGVENMIAFCKDFNIKLYHLSTLSVSGNVFAEGSFDGASIKEKSTFKEKDLYIHQDISNIYVYTKFMAERTILESIAKNELQGCIIRLGNITNRYSDGKFQINISENAFLNRILTFIKLGCIPDYLLEGYGEFTPVDYVASAITKLVQCKTDYTVFHIYNNKHLPMDKLIALLNKYGLKMDILPEKEFLEVVDKALNSDKNILSGIINDFDTNKKLIYDSNIILNNDFTNEFLAKLSFKWCKIGKGYLFKYLNYLKDLGYLGGN